MGKEVQVLLDRQLPAGNHEVRWNTENLTNGIYFFRVQSGIYGETRKLILIRG